MIKVSCFLFMNHNFTSVHIIFISFHFCSRKHDTQSSGFLTGTVAVIRMPVFSRSLGTPSFPLYNYTGSFICGNEVKNVTLM
jgi:hypothetical protein